MPCCTGIGPSHGPARHTAADDWHAKAAAWAACTARCLFHQGCLLPCRHNQRPLAVQQASWPCCVWSCTQQCDALHAWQQLVHGQGMCKPEVSIQISNYIALARYNVQICSLLQPCMAEGSMVCTPTMHTPPTCCFSFTIQAVTATPKPIRPLRTVRGKG